VLYSACNYIEQADKRLHENLTISARKSFHTGFSSVIELTKNPRCCDSKFGASKLFLGPTGASTTQSRRVVGITKSLSIQNPAIPIPFRGIPISEFLVKP
jgi:hypothetical protein